MPRSELPNNLWFVDHVVRANLYPCQHRIERRDSFLEAMFKMAEGYWFSPAELVMSALFYFEQRVHVKKLKRATIYDLFFPRLLSQVIESTGLISNVAQERKIDCREIFDQRKWYFCTLGKEATTSAKSNSAAPSLDSPSAFPSGSTADIGSPMPSFQSPDQTSTVPEPSPTPTGPVASPCTAPPPIVPPGQPSPTVHSTSASAAPATTTDTIQWLCTTVASLQAHQAQQTQHLVTITSLLVHHLTGMEIPPPPAPPQMQPPPIPMYSPVHPMTTLEETRPPAAAPAHADIPPAVAESAPPSAEDQKAAAAPSTAPSIS